MDLGIGFISTNIMLPILDFFHGIVPSYGFAIIALTLVIRFAVYPLSAGSIRNMRRTRIAQPVMQKRVKEVQERYKEDPKKLQEAMGEVYKEYGNPLAGCLPLLFQLPILWALFTTLRGSPFADINYTVDLQIFSPDQTEQIQPQIFTTKPQNIYLNADVHYRLAAVLPTGNRLVVGDEVHPEFQSEDGVRFATLKQEYADSKVEPTWTVTKGEGNVAIAPDGTITALAPGEVTLQGTVPGIATNEGFLFINALGRIGATGEDGAIHWDIVGMVLFFGVSTYISQQLTGAGGGGGAQNEQQQTISKITPILFSGMFLIFPLPAGVLMYMTVANVFQTAQTFILMREPLPDNLQKLVEEQEKQEAREEGRSDIPFEPKRSKKKEKTSG